MNEATPVAVEHTQQHHDHQQNIDRIDRHGPLKITAIRSRCNSHEQLLLISCIQSTLSQFKFANDNEFLDLFCGDKSSTQKQCLCFLIGTIAAFPTRDFCLP
jgi:hypothetical protein